MLLLLGSYYAVQAMRRPPRSNLTQPLYQGITYHRIVKNEPRRMMVHVMEVDVMAEGVELFVTPPDRSGERYNMLARKTTDFAEEFSAEIAVNASFFYTFTVGNPLTFYPKVGDPVAIAGSAIYNGEQYGNRNGFKKLCFLEQEVMIRLSGCPLQRVQHAVSGNAVFLRDGVPYDDGYEYNTRAYGRVAAAIDDSGQTLWLILIDNKQWGYSNGASLVELADIALDLGATQAINLDGGGSSTMVSAHSGRPRILNSPIHTGVLGRERPVGNHIGIHALPLSNDVAQR